MQLDLGAFLNSVVYIVPLLALMLSIVTFTNASKERHAKSASEAAALKEQLIFLSQQVEDLKRSYNEADDGFHKNATRITKLEEQVKTLWNKAEELEREVRKYVD